MGNYKTGPGNYKSKYLVTIVKKDNQIVNNSSTMVNDNELFCPLKPNRTYNFQLTFFCAVFGASDFKYDFTIPSGPRKIKIWIKLEESYMTFYH